MYFVSSKIYGTSTKGTYSSVESSQGGGGGARGLTEDNHDEEEEKYEDDTDSQCTGGNCENPDTSAPDNIPKGANSEGKPKDVKLGGKYRTLLLSYIVFLELLQSNYLSSTHIISFYFHSSPYLTTFCSR